MKTHARSAAWALGGGVILVVALFWASRRVATPPKPPGPVVDSEANCATLRSRYRAAIAALERCTRDDECTVEGRSGVRSGLDGCARYRRVDAKLDELVTPIEEAWLARGCAQHFMTCGPRRAQCKEGVCAELPPEPVPRTWRRVLHTTEFSFFVPPELAPQEVMHEDSEGGMFEGPRYTLYYEYGQYSPSLEAKKDDGDVRLHWEPTTISGVAANLSSFRAGRGGVLSGVQIPEAPTSARGDARLSLWAYCKTVEDCAELSVIARSIEFH